MRNRTKKLKLSRSRLVIPIVSGRMRKKRRSRVRDPGGFRKNGLISTSHDTRLHQREEGFCRTALNRPKLSRSRLRRSRIVVSLVSRGVCKSRRSQWMILAGLRNDLIRTFHETAETGEGICGTALKCRIFSITPSALARRGLNCVGTRAQNMCSRVRSVTLAGFKKRSD